MKNRFFHGNAGVLFLVLLLLSVATAPAQIAEIVFSAPFGDQQGDMGIINKPEMEKCGPLSFCVEGKNVFILDSVDKELVLASPDGKSKVVAKNITGWSLCGDGMGGVFIQNENSVSHLGTKGQTKALYKVSNDPKTAEKLIQGYGNELFVGERGQVSLRSVTQKVYPVAGAKALSSPVSDTSLDYQIKRFAKNEVRILGFEKGGKALVSVPVKIDGGKAGAVLFKGTDSKGNLYVELENIKNNKAFLEVHRYSQKGERLAVFELSNDYFTTVYKKTQVAPDGSVYQMLTTEQGVRILRYGKEG